MKNPLINCKDVVDSREVIEYKEYLEQEILDAYIQWAENHNDYCEDGSEIEVPESFGEIEYVDEESFTTCYPELFEEYELITDFCDELEGYGNFEYGEAIIHRNYFGQYCEELCEELGGLHKELPSYIEKNIDWDGVADDLEVDYMTANYRDEEFLMRA